MTKTDVAHLRDIKYVNKLDFSMVTSTVVFKLSSHSVYFCDVFQSPPVENFWRF